MGSQIDSPLLEKTTLKNPSLIRVNVETTLNKD